MRILIADDNDLVRRGLSQLISTQAGLNVCGEAIDGSEVLQKAQELRPDLILLDISMPRMNGLEAARLLRREFPKTKILVLTQNDAIRLLPHVLEIGADGCVDKSLIGTDLLPAIDTLNRGETAAPLSADGTFSPATS